MTKIETVDTDEAISIETIEVETENKEATETEAQATEAEEIEETSEDRAEIPANDFRPHVPNNGFVYKKKAGYLAVKRVFDVVSSLFASILLLLPMAVIALLIFVKDPGNPFYIHTRVGKSGKPLKLLKFRTMRKGADKLENMLSPEQLEEYKREYKLDDDPRLIGYKRPGDGCKCFGAVLRRFSLDELPQIPFNILLRGDMSVVGPRPIMEDELQENYTPDEQKMLLSVKPGLTGYWQAYARNDALYETGERQKMELYYIENCSVKLDIKIIFATVLAVVKKSGAK